MRESATGRPEPLIIRRSEIADLDYTTTGVWKIAYADFMTAMMAFFLVMWLVNATSDTTKTGIATYFNPIRLSDTTDLSRKGLHDPGVAETGTEVEPASVSMDRHAGEKQRESTARAANPEGGLILRDPYAVLAAIAAETAVKAEPDAAFATPMGAAGTGNPAGAPPYLRDPFERLSASSGQSREDVLTMAEMQPEEKNVARLTGQGTAKPPEGDVAAGSAVSPGGASGQGIGGGQPGQATRQQMDSIVAEPETKAPAARLVESVRAEKLPEVTIRDGDDGVLISLSDHAQFGMFAIGSADPLPETVEIMERIAGLLGDLPGRVIISGHTDGRPFRSKDHGNWQLSAARAQMAYQMLVEGGLDEARVIRIEGHADRELKIPDDPSAAENRRIEILVERISS